MAKATIECTCPECGAKHTWSVICHNRREADNWEQYHADDTDRLCPACYAKQQAAKRAEEREAENKAAAEKAGALGLPELSGTEKQVAWATTIRQQAIDSALMESAGRTSAGMTDKGRAFVAGVIAKMSAEAKWWIDHRDDAAHLVREEIECANWARLDDATRAAHMAKLRARLAGRGSMEQRHADKDAKRAALPAKPATLAERVGKPGARWNQKFYGRDGLRVYLDGEEVQITAEVKAAWNAEWTAYNAAKKAAGIA